MVSSNSATTVDPEASESRPRLADSSMRTTLDPRIVRRKGSSPAEVEGEGSQRSGGGQDLVQGDELVRAVGESDLARSVLQRRNTADSGHQPQITAVRGDVGLLRGTADDGVRRTDPVDQIAGLRQTPAGELPAPPLDRRRMITEPRITVAGLGDSLLEFVARRLDGLAEGNTEPTFCNEQIRNGGRPVACMDRADLQWIGNVPSPRPRVGVGIATCLQVLQGDQQWHELLDSADTFGSPRSVRCESRNGQAERQCSGICRDEVEVRRFRDDACVCPPAACKRAVRA